MTLQVPPFSFKRTPSIPDMASRLIQALPGEERQDAIRLLLDHILPAKLATMAHHPRPIRLCSVVYKELSRILSSQPPNMRLHALRLCAFDVFIGYLLREAQNLAIARYLLEHRDLQPAALGHWHNPQVTELCILQVEDITEIAERAQASLQEWRDSVVSGYPTEWPKHKDRHEQARAALLAAVTGDYQQLVGPLRSFLDEHGLQVS